MVEVQTAIMMVVGVITWFGILGWLGFNVARLKTNQIYLLKKVSELNCESLILKASSKK